MKTLFLSILVCLLLSCSLAMGQAGDPPFEYHIEWKNPVKSSPTFDEPKSFLSFEGAQYDIGESDLPFLYLRLPTGNSVELSSATLLNAKYVDLSDEEQELELPDYKKENIELEIINAIAKKEHISFVKLYPFRYNPSKGKLEKLLSFQISYSVNPASVQRGEKNLTYASSSVLATGNWFKIGVTENGMYKLSYHFLKNIGMDVDNIDPRNLRLYGNGSGQLPEMNNEARPDDLLENSIEVVGEDDGQFDPGDYVVFYGEGVVEWNYDRFKKVYKHENHYFSDTNFYFVTADLGPGKRVGKRSDGNALSASRTITTFLDFQVLEQDKVNLIHSGKEWLGDVYDSKTNYTYSFNFPNAIKDSTSWFKFFGVVRSGATSNFSISLANKSFKINATTTQVGEPLVPYGTESVADYTFQPTSDLLQMNVSYSKPLNTSRAWLNYIEMNVWRKLSYTGNQMGFRHPYATDLNQVYEFQIQNAVPHLSLWDVTDIHNIVEQEYFSDSQGNTIFRLSAENIREFMAFDVLDSNVFPKGRVANQNLHGLGQIDMAIVSHPSFLQSAQQLGEFHESEGLNVAVVTPQQIYNEFSSGVQDPIAIRTFMKMFYDRANNSKELPKYLLLFGDASYDPKNRISGNTNFVITYESNIYLDPIKSYSSDDYFGFLDDKEGRWLNDKLDIGVGRLPVRTQQEAQAMVRKIVEYSSNLSYGQWRNEIVFIGDDEDQRMHMEQANTLARIVDTTQGDFNISRIFIDSYQQVSTPAGERYPDVNKEITEKVEKGSLIINYTGHGGETGLAEERILTLSDITSWNNKYNYPLFITATCEFSRYDDPLRVSAGEEVLLNPNGGSIGLLTTTRPAFAQLNFDMSKFLYHNLFNRLDGEPLTVGEIYRQVKVNKASVLNARNFTYLGDPAIQLAIPKHTVVTTEINGEPLSNIDTLNALSTVTVSGYIANYESGQKIEDFNGIVYPTVFDKVRSVSSLNNDKIAAGPINYTIRDSRLFNGKASVSNGEFSFTFVVPKDISYEIGEGKITYYATDQKTDANGATTSLLIGGSSDSNLTDNNGPELEVYMNSKDFVYGGMTNENPTVVIEFFDELGINTVGNGIGHDITMVVDGNTEKAIVLNEFYEASVDDYRSGKVEYQLKDLSEGKHSLTIKSWDVANNSSERTIEFVVVKEKDIEIEHVLNYPNPFTTNTEFWFEHNQPGIPLDVKIQVFTVSGKLVKSIDKVIVSEGFRVDDIAWDGRDDFGDKIGRGVYLYKLKVRSRNGSMAEKIEKLVIL